MMMLIDFYKKNGIDMCKDMGVKNFAFTQNDTLKLLDLLQTNNIELYGVDLVYVNEQGLFSYLTLPEEYVSWSLENIKVKDRYSYLKEKILNYKNIKSRKVYFSLVDSISYTMWERIIQHCWTDNT